jgi:P-type conjugative transfer protein TrbJ
MTSRFIVRPLGLCAAALALAITPAQALVVYDPTNYASNVMQAARALQQINNQIRSLQNEATSLLNDTKNLANLPFSSLQALQQQVRQTQRLLGQAQRLAYDVTQIEQAFSTKYGDIALSSSDADLVAGARDRWSTSVDAFEDALKVQAGVVGNIDGTRTSMDDLVSASQSASGALQVAQAGNQLVALQSQQLADITAMLAAQGRAQTIEAARAATAEAEGRVRFQRFMARSGQ